MQLIRKASVFVVLIASALTQAKPTTAPLVTEPKKVAAAHIEEIETTDALKKVLSGQNKPVVLLFYADWCGACKALKPHLTTIAERYKKQARFLKINADNEECKEAIDFFGIEAIPTLIFKNVGIMDEKQLEMTLKNFLGKEACPPIESKKDKKTTKPVKNKPKKEKSPKKGTQKK